MNGLVVGSGGREHALAQALQSSLKLERVYVAPGNGGTENNVPINDDDVGELADFASKNDCFTIVGPETAITAGITNEFAKKDLPIFAPSLAASKLESSKSWAKDFMIRHKIPTAEYGVFEDAASAINFAKNLDYHVAVKADGLAAGKGVIICDKKEQVLESIDEMLGGKFGSAGHRIVVERCITGPEASFIAMCDGKSHMQLATSQDHKRIGDGNTGPNTGGMGAYSPATVIDAENEKKLDQIMAKTVDGMRSEGNAFVGFLYAGVISGLNPIMAHTFGEWHLTSLWYAHIIIDMERCFRSTVSRCNVYASNFRLACSACARIILVHQSLQQVRSRVHA